MTTAEATADRTAVLTDPHLDTTLRDRSLAMVPLLGASEMRELNDIYWSTVPAEAGLQLDYLRSDTSIRRALADAVEPIWDRVIPAMFERHYPIYSSFVVKHPDPDSGMFLHRDLPVTDERFERAYSIWIPLEDVGVERDNGVFEIVPGSERLPHGSFGLNGPALFSPFHRFLAERLVPMSVTAGTALVYDARLLHASTPNRTTAPRLAIGCLLAARDRPVVHIMPTGRRHRLVYEVDRDFFIDHHPAEIIADGMPERYRVIDEFDEEPTLDADAVAATFESPAPRGDAEVPADLRPTVHVDEPLDLDAADVVVASSDPDLAASSLPTITHDLAGVAVSAVSGEVGALPVTRSHVGASPVPASAHALLAPSRARSVRHLTLIVVDPSGRVTLTAPARRGFRDELVVLEASAVAAGMVTAHKAAEVRPGSALTMRPGTSVTLWNQGPGPLVVVVRTRPRWA